MRDVGEEYGTTSHRDVFGIFVIEIVFLEENNTKRIKIEGYNLP